MKHVVNIALIAIWMGFIFFMSHQSGSESSELSGKVVTIFEFLKVDIHSSFGQVLHQIIRKGAHLFEYFVLSLLFYNFLKEFLSSWAMSLPIIGSFIYACSDEFHQTFIANRAGSFGDVLIDTTGAVVAMVMVYLYHRILFNDRH